mgnify:FL=1
MKKAIVIGAGFSGLSAATYLAKNGWAVTVLEKHLIPGGRARKLERNGFTFDMGPSWYWMPEVFEQYFNHFGKKVCDYYQLIRLDPSYKVYFSEENFNIPAGYEQLQQLFESIEKGAAANLDKFLKEAEYKYFTGTHNLVHKPGLSLLEFADAQVIKGIFKLDVFTHIKKHIAKYFTHPYLRSLLEFPVLFLGALPKNTPALYSLMNYADIKLGTWYPQGGMYQVVNAMYKLAKDMGVQFYFNTEVKKINAPLKNEMPELITVCNNHTKIFKADTIIGSADYHHIDTELLGDKNRNYSNAYWNKRTLAPSCLLYFVGINKKLKHVVHHSLFFDTDFEKHGNEIYAAPSWPHNPLFYVSIPSVTDSSVAPKGCENLLFLVPVAAGLSGDDEALRKRYFNKILSRFEQLTGNSIKNDIIFYQSYSVTDFANDYHAFKGNAYGLANTLRQTAILKPSIKSNKVKNLYFAGQLTVPGPGVPPCIISGEVVAKQIIKDFGDTWQ